MPDADPTDRPAPPPPLAAGDVVAHPKFGRGVVMFDAGATVVGRFDHGIEECERSDVARQTSPRDALIRDAWDAPAEVVARVLAEAIRSVNDAWGVFSRSRIALLPHQLWVCRRVLAQWPTRWLIADDVGLGKTIEAGLVLWPLLSGGRVRRLLILCPASLVEQWAERLRRMFDIRLNVYAAGSDTARADFWGANPQVVASLETLRGDAKGRHDRLFEAPPWDLLIVDEAHRLNADEEAGPTLGYRLVQRLVDERRVESVLLFSGTPHRGKDFGFLSLLKLLRPDDFHPRRPASQQLHRMRDVVIRNNKQNVTDLRGNRLFHAPRVSSETYAYSPTEERFYATLTEFITTGKAYASRLSSTDGRAVMLVLIAMQKLASSSVAAIRRALRNRLARVAADRRRLALETVQPRSLVDRFDDVDAEGGEAGDELARLEEDVAVTAALRLMEDEEARLAELLATADAVTRETKIESILALLDGRFADRTVLFFTEYKATQSLLMSRLIARYGDDCVAFINGDGRADDVTDAAGRARKLPERRETAADRFNAGHVRFLVSTEAGGEGIDLQERCHTLVHVDLPWNPMRLHQRVGRLNRYGQTRPVEVVTLRNPDTVESRIWLKLNAKIEAIQSSLGAAMDEPEDLMQLVLGMTSPAVFRSLFTDAADVPANALNRWFDDRTATFGGRDVIDAVRDLVGHCSSFDYQQVSDQLPRLDLPHLKPFLLLMLAINRRRARDDADGLAFKTPEPWLDEVGVAPDYDGLVFDRQRAGRDAVLKVVGVGHKAFDRAIRQALALTASTATLPAASLPTPILAFRVSERVTSAGGHARNRLVAVEGWPGAMRVMTDDRLIERLNAIAGPSLKREASPTRTTNDFDILKASADAEHLLLAGLSDLNLGVKLPVVSLYAALVPELE